ncbi:hypothetical protein MKQ70_14800 [Chitinophaga sedimenti]|uniref:hypothetical protein n=1 Tax=Chitinophaga sedimenti TaxID=2033606 RepID=UPI0020061264|nr:hypothetical protein [Chitinophaga sedimenti]MCK7556214.1 hypothetical protein [Chitinophaga sedimenti]
MYSKQLLPFYAIILTMTMAEMACKPEPSRPVDWQEVIDGYAAVPGDSLQLAAAIFLRDNMSDLESEVVDFQTKDGKVIDIRLDTITSEESLLRIMDAQQLHAVTRVVPDSLLLTNEMIRENIAQSLAAWRKYPWNKSASWQMFLEYLLPYKVRRENPENWRNYFTDRYHSHLTDTLQKYDGTHPGDTLLTIPNELYYDIVVDDIGRWYKYEPSATLLATTSPGLIELKAVSKGECYRGSHLGVYALRAIGIPSTIDLVPVWGSQNSGHATEVFLDEHGKMSTASGRTLERAAKVFRQCFKRINYWKDSIAPHTKGSAFLLQHLIHNHWMDVTHEHTNVSDITYQLGDTTDASFAYICVYNYGKWVPIFLGACTNGTAVFRQMGRNMLYQVAIPAADGYTLTGDIFLLNTEGKIVRQSPDINGPRMAIQLHKLNTGSLSWVKKQHVYNLLYLDTSGIWHSAGVQKCMQDSSITFPDVPRNALYRLVDRAGDGRLERIFSLDKNEQVWR